MVIEIINTYKNIFTIDLFEIFIAIANFITLPLIICTRLTFSVLPSLAQRNLEVPMRFEVS